MKKEMSKDYNRDFLFIMEWKTIYSIKFLNIILKYPLDNSLLCIIYIVFLLLKWWARTYLVWSAFILDFPAQCLHFTVLVKSTLPWQIEAFLYIFKWSLSITGNSSQFWSSALWPAPHTLTRYSPLLAKLCPISSLLSPQISLSLVSLHPIFQD